jgi:toxin FitB
VIIVDTNVVSELLRPIPDPRVDKWIAAQDGYDIYLTAISEAELRYGVAIMDKGRRRDALAEAIDRILGEDMDRRILPFDSAAAIEYATIAATRRATGRPIAQADCQIAAIARAHGAAVITRNIADFEGCGVNLIDPWTAD